MEDKKVYKHNLPPPVRLFLDQENNIHQGQENNIIYAQKHSSYENPILINRSKENVAINND